MKYYFVLFIAVVFAVDAARALECHFCEYHEGAPLEGSADPDPGYLDESCKNGNKPKTEAKVCEPEEDLCVKVYVQGERDGEQIKSTLRDCSRKTNFPGFETGQCLDKVGKELGYICVCSGDKCNSSEMLKMKNSFIIISMGVLVCKFLNF